MTAVPLHTPRHGRVLTVDEAAAYLRISRGLAFAAVRDGTLPSIRIGRRIRVPLRQLEALLDGDKRSSEMS
jgi:excisionase family DNA binding protein